MTECYPEEIMQENRRLRDALKEAILLAGDGWLCASLPKTLRPRVTAKEMKSVVDRLEALEAVLRG